MNYKGFEIAQDNTGFAPEEFSYFLDDGEIYVGSGKSIDECKAQIDLEIIADKIEPLIIDWLKSDDENASNLTYLIANKLIQTHITPELLNPSNK